MIATKEEERQVLEKIKKMVAELGENSYLAAAFTGSFEMGIFPGGPFYFSGYF